MQQSAPIEVNLTTGGVKRAFLTTLSNILLNKDLCMFDMGSAQGLSQELNSCGEILFNATVDGIPIRFKARGMRISMLNGHLMFAVSIPKSLYWRERRGARRYPIPLETPIACLISLPGLNPLKFPVLNISETGFCLLDENQYAADTVKAGHIFQGCRFSNPPELAKEPFSAELHTGVAGTNGVFLSVRLGMRFVNPSSTFLRNLRGLLDALNWQSTGKNKDN